MTAIQQVVPSFIDGNDAFTKVLLHCEGTNGGTVITDTAIGATGAHSWGAFSSAVTSTTAQKFGTTSVNCGAGAGFCQVLDHADFTLGSGDWTVDCWVNVQGGAGVVRLVAGQGDASASAANQTFYLDMQTSNAFRGGASDGTTTTYALGTTAISTTGWHHVALTRNGNILRLFVDGVQEGGNVAFTGTIPNSTFQLSIGTSGTFGSNWFNGFIDEFRLSVGIARWTANFTPPARAYGPN